MANLQSQFVEFHRVIRMDYDISETLRNSRDKVCERITKHLKDEGLPGFRRLLQGSYKMKTGVRPPSDTDLEFDIDVGLRFDVDPEEYSAASVRKWVMAAVSQHTKEVKEKGPCIRVIFSKGYHVDLVVYSVVDEGGIDRFRLAHKSQGWLDADPPKLEEFVDQYRERFAETTDSKTQTDQFRRSIRYLRRWNDVCLPFEAKHKPSGLAFVLLAIQHRLAPKTLWDGTQDDAGALSAFVHVLTIQAGRLTARKPTPLYEDVLERLSDDQVEQFKDRLIELDKALDDARTSDDIVEACTRLREVFGDDFPVPDPSKSVRETSAPAVLTSSSSA